MPAKICASTTAALPKSQPRHKNHAERRNHEPATHRCNYNPQPGCPRGVSESHIIPEKATEPHCLAIAAAITTPHKD